LPNTKFPKLSVVIPALEEEDYLPRTLRCLCQRALDTESLEILVIDAGSADKTVNIAKQYTDKVFVRPAVRGMKFRSLQLGVEEARADTILFVDADTLVPRHFDRLILEAMKQENVAGGAFGFSFDQRGVLPGVISWANSVRYRSGKIFFGDQGVFCHRALAWKAGGIPKEPLMEAAYFCRALKKHGKMVIINSPVKTSFRRFAEHGVLKVLWFDAMMWIRFVLRLPVRSFASRYWDP